MNSLPRTKEQWLAYYEEQALYIDDQILDHFDEMYEIQDDENGESEEPPEEWYVSVAQAHHFIINSGYEYSQ